MRSELGKGHSKLLSETSDLVSDSVHVSFLPLCLFLVNILHTASRARGSSAHDEFEQIRRGERCYLFKLIMCTAPARTREKS
jgi:hypothetical protein